MKKFLAMLLCLTMLLCITPVIASAEGSTTETTDTGITADGGITSVKGLQNLANQSGDYYLANDIYVDLSTATLPLIPNTFTGTLDGKNNSILFKDEETGTLTNKIEKAIEGVLFVSTKAKEVKNLTVGSSDAPVTVTTSKANFGIIGKETNGVATVFENVVVYGNITTTRTGANNVSLFLAKTVNQVKFYDCKAIGSITAKCQDADVKFFGGFVGRFEPKKDASKGMTLTVSGCISDMDMLQAEGYYVGYNGMYAGGFLGGISEVQDNVYADNFKAINSISIFTCELASSAGNAVAHSGEFYGGTSITTEPTEGETTYTITNCATPSTLAVGLALTTDNAASVRFNAPTGIRFYNTVSGLYDTLVNYCGADNVKMGTIIAPKQYIENAGAFTKDALDALNVTSEKKYLDVEYKDEWYETSEDTNTYTYVGSIADILEDNYEVEFCGIGYISYNDGTEWKTIYASYDEGEGIPAFSVRALATAVTNDANATEAEKAAVAKYLATDNAE